METQLVKFTLIKSRLNDWSVAPPSRRPSYPSHTPPFGTGPFPHLRLDIPFTVGVSEDIGRVRDLALSVYREDTTLMTSPAPQVLVKALNDYNLALELRVWLDDEKRHVEARHNLRERLYERLRAEGVEMPFETLALTSA